MSHVAFQLRDATPDDVGTIHALVLALARYEKLEHQVQASPDDLRQALFGEPARAHALLVEADGRAIGFAVWCYNFSTFLGRHGLYVEDVYVDAACRGRGVGRAIFAYLAARALAEGCGRMEWSVLDWNAPSIAFYRSIGALAMDSWTVQRLEGDSLAALAATAPLTSGH